MQVIDLLNKIANCEELPIKIEFMSKIFVLSYVGYEQASYISNGKSLLEGWNATMCLTDDIEIIEDKKIEKLQAHETGSLDFRDKINELIDEVNKLKGESNE